MPGKKQQITICTTSCFEMGCRWVYCSLRQQANLYCHILIILDRKKHGFLQSRTSLNSPRTTILIHFSWKRAYFPLFPKSVKVSLALHSLREPCPRVTAGLVRLPRTPDSLLPLIKVISARICRMTIPPYHARSIYNSRMHSCPVMTSGSRPSRTKSCSRVCSAAP